MSNLLHIAYFRPAPEEVSEERAKELISGKQVFSGGVMGIDVTQLDKNIWRLGHITKAYDGGYTTRVLMKQGNKYIRFSIPTNKNGQLMNEAVMAMRVLDTDDGDRYGKERNAFIDFSITAKEHVTKEDLAKSYHWWLYPNESDIKSLDDTNTKILKSLDSVKHGRRKLIIIGGSAEGRNAIADAIDKSFTIREKRILGNSIIRIAGVPRGLAGTFHGSTDEKGSPKGISVITISSRYANKSDIIIHEAIHALRTFDAKRHPKLRHVRQYTGRDADLEESLTEAETVAREKPLTMHGHPWGYYHYVKIPDPETGLNKPQEKLVIEDRVEVTTPKDGWEVSGLRGQRALKALLLHYPAMHISKLKIRGPAEAVDTFHRLDDPIEKNTIIHTQSYSPKGGVEQEKRIDREMAKLSPNVSKFSDGKEIKLKGGEAMDYRTYKIGKHEVKVSSGKDGNREWTQYDYSKDNCVVVQRVEGSAWYIFHLEGRGTKAPVRTIDANWKRNEAEKIAENFIKRLPPPKLEEKRTIIKTAIQDPLEKIGAVRIKTSETTKKEAGMIPHRIVLWKRLKDKSFGTHVEVLDEKGAYLVGGNYDMSLSEAQSDYKKRCELYRVSPQPVRVVKVKTKFKGGKASGYTLGKPVKQTVANPRPSPPLHSKKRGRIFHTRVGSGKVLSRRRLG